MLPQIMDHGHVQVNRLIHTHEQFPNKKRTGSQFVCLGVESTFLAFLGFPNSKFQYKLHWGFRSSVEFVFNCLSLP